MSDTSTTEQHASKTRSESAGSSSEEPEPEKQTPICWQPFTVESIAGDYSRGREACCGSPEDRDCASGCRHFGLVRAKTPVKTFADVVVGVPCSAFMLLGAVAGLVSATVGAVDAALFSLCGCCEVAHKRCERSVFCCTCSGLCCAGSGQLLLRSACSVLQCPGNLLCPEAFGLLGVHEFNVWQEKVARAYELKTKRMMQSFATFRL